MSKAFNDPTVECCNRDAANCDCPNEIKKAREFGAEHGKNAASWYFDGNVPIETYRTVLKGIDDGDPAILDTFPRGNMSGEWADGYDTKDLVSNLELENDELLDQCVNAYQEAFDDAVRDEIERVARYQTEPNWLYIKDCEGY